MNFSHTVLKVNLNLLTLNYCKKIHFAHFSKKKSIPNISTKKFIQIKRFPKFKKALCFREGVKCQNPQKSFQELKKSLHFREIQWGINHTSSLKCNGFFGPKSQILYYICNKVRHYILLPDRQVHKIIWWIIIDR